jgi:hypothetical protein
MSNDSLHTPPCLDASEEAAPLGWLLSMLREAMVGVMADDTPALKKANALARLANLYLKAYKTADLKRTNAELVARVAELEQRLTTSRIETASGEEEASGQSVSEQNANAAAIKPGRAKHPKPGSHGKNHSTGHHNGRPRPKPKPSPAPR